MSYLPAIPRDLGESEMLQHGSSDWWEELSLTPPTLPPSCVVESDVWWIKLEFGLPVALVNNCRFSSGISVSHRFRFQTQFSTSLQFQSVMVRLDYIEPLKDIFIWMTNEQHTPASHLLATANAGLVV